MADQKNREEIDSKASELYHKVGDPAYLASIKTLQQRVQDELGRPIKLNDIADFLLGERAHTQFRTRRRHIPRRQIKKIGIFETFSCDLGDLQALKDFNHGMGWLFLAVDNFSKFIFLEAAPTKEKKSMLACFSKMMETGKKNYKMMKMIFSHQWHSLRIIQLRPAQAQE